MTTGCRAKPWSFPSTIPRNSSRGARSTHRSELAPKAREARVSFNTGSKPASFILSCNWLDRASTPRPIAVILCGTLVMSETRASGALATCASVAVLLFSPRTQTAVLTDDTSRSINASSRGAVLQRVAASLAAGAPGHRQTSKGHDAWTSDVATSASGEDKRRTPVRYPPHSRTSSNAFPVPLGCCGSHVGG